MTSAASHHPFNRLPTTSELEEMAKSVVISYPCLRDAETGHVSITLCFNSVSCFFSSG